MKRLGIVRVTYEILAQLIGLDENHKVEDVISERNERTSNLIQVKVSGPQFREVPEGSFIEWVDINEVREWMGKGDSK